MGLLSVASVHRLALIWDCPPSQSGSGVLQLDEAQAKVRAVPEKRCILILREIPKETGHEVLVLLVHMSLPAAIIANG